ASDERVNPPKDDLDFIMGFLHDLETNSNAGGTPGGTYADIGIANRANSYFIDNFFRLSGEQRRATRKVQTLGDLATIRMGRSLIGFGIASLASGRYGKGQIGDYEEYNDPKNRADRKKSAEETINKWGTSGRLDKAKVQHYLNLLDTYYP
ncbi:MAG: hypothetical protein JNM63_13760, partial [Spirochaetia bacterium]|nr:hypothetical protein [Spirochaetia bacterium]